MDHYLKNEFKILICVLGIVGIILVILAFLLSTFPIIENYPKNKELYTNCGLDSNCINANSINNTTGYHNTAIGYKTGMRIEEFNYTIVLGHNLEPTKDRQITIRARNGKIIRIDLPDDFDGVDYKMFDWEIKEE